MLAGSGNALLELAATIALTHHERWDGAGYPAGLRGEEIPLGARICAVCDVFDALISARRYKRRWPLAAALDELRAERGRHFDPAVVDAFLTMIAADAQADPSVGVLTIGQSTPAGATERIHSRSSLPPTRA